MERSEIRGWRRAVTPPPHCASLHAGYDSTMSEQEPLRPDDYVETPRDRRIANAVLLLFLILVVGGGIWLANAMFEQRALDNCISQGRPNCAAPVDARR
jgi:hypothetical protein